MKARYLRRLLRLYRRRVNPQEIISRDLARELCALSFELKRQLGLLLNRRGNVAYVIIGDHRRIFLPDLKRFRIGKSRLRGLRLIHTHLKGEPLSTEDISDMLLLRLDLVALLHAKGAELAESLEVAHINPNPESATTAIQLQLSFSKPLPNFLEMVASLEEELHINGAAKQSPLAKERAVIVHVWNRRDSYGDEILQEMQMLAASSDVEVVDVVTQYGQKLHPAYLLGRGKLTDLAVQALCQGVDILLFSRNLTANQVRHLADLTDLKIIDRTQLILDIFARHASSRDGKLQVELAQLRYIRPRLSHQGTAMSRLMGGIGGRGPGEMKLEIDRRRIRERIGRLEKEIKHLSALRGRKRELRRRRGVPVVALVGYTNVGKSTLFNLLSGANVATADAAFATLDPTNRRVRLPNGREVIFLDTVGFIRDLPADLLAAFRATLEEIREANVIVHVVDASHEDLSFQMESVQRLLVEMGYTGIPQICVLNKIDKLSELEVKLLAKKLDALALCALDKESSTGLLRRLETLLFSRTHQRQAAPYSNR